MQGEAPCLMLDVDGVAITGHPEDGRSWAADIERDLGIAPAELQERLFAPHWADIVTGRQRLDRVLAECLPDLAPGLGVAAFLDYWFSRDARIERGVLAACDALRAAGWRVFFATNQEPLRADFLMERLGLAAHAEAMLHSARLGAKKPDPAFFEAAAAMAGQAPESLFLVDDTEANIRAARAAGWRAALWTGGEDLRTLCEGV